MKKPILKPLGLAAVLAALAVPAGAQMFTGPNSSAAPYQVPVVPGARITSVLTAGDTVNGYRMVGIPDGIGAWDNGDSTWTLILNHELGNSNGAIRAHGSRGAFNSKWILSKNVNNMQVISGSDLTQRVHLYNPATNSYTAYSSANPLPSGTAGNGLTRFCSGDLPAVSAFYNAATGKGTQERIMMNGEESGTEGRAFAHIASGAHAGYSYELPYLGKFSWENSVARPHASDTTVVIGMDDATPGQVYVYVGVKQAAGNEITRAGLTGGKLYGIAVNGMVTETSAGIPAANTAFTLIEIDTVHKMDGVKLNSLSNTAGITSFLRPEDGAWDPRKPGDFYFLTTNSFSSPSRMWHVHFTNPGNPAAGGTIEAVLDGTEGQRMMDNLGIGYDGFALVQEDVGGNDHLGRTWQYSLDGDSFKMVLMHDSLQFLPGKPNYITNDEEGSGMIDMQSILGAGYFFGVDQVHKSVGGEIVEGGQMFLFFNPDSYNANPEISLAGNGQAISNGSMNPSGTNNTDFGNISNGGTTTRTFILKNEGPAALKVSSITLAGTNASDFTLVGAPAFPLTLAAGSTQTLTVQFSPTVIGLRTAVLHIKSNDFDEANYSVALRGISQNTTGVAALPGGGGLKLYPNPTGEAATVELSLKATEHIRLTVLDMGGRTVIDGTDTPYPAGDHKLRVNTSGLANGTYFVQLSAGNQITRMKLVVIH